MKNITRGIGLLLAGLLAFGQPLAQAQNLQPQFNANNVGAPGLTLNSGGGGSYYGQVFNLSGAQSSTSWGFAYGTSQTANGTTVAIWNQMGQFAIGTSVPGATSIFHIGSNSAVAVKTNGWLEYHQQQPPIASTCGTNPSPVSGTDQAGDVTLGTSASATCTLTFAEAPTNIPHCSCTDRTRARGCFAIATATTLVLAGSSSSALQDTDIIDYNCGAHQ